MEKTADFDILQLIGKNKNKQKFNLNKHRTPFEDVFVSVITSISSSVVMDFAVWSETASVR